MKYKRILVTGGAGFIGSHLVDGLLSKGYTVRVMDNLLRQIHPGGKTPGYFNKKAQFMKGDVTNPRDWKKALLGVDAVYHFAAAVGVGQSMYEIARYVKVNSYGTALFLDILANQPHNVKKIVIAASMSSYGEGLYRCKTCGIVQPPLRDEARLKKKDFALYCPNCHKTIVPVATNETARQNSNSIYAIGKKEQEEMVLTFGKSYGVPSVALRYFNVYGTRQSLSNPYNGVAAIFLSRVKNGHPPIINEDGNQTRDFVHIKDVTAANIMALESGSGMWESYNVGSGRPITIKEVARIIIKELASRVKPEISGKVRKLDVVHCFADTTKIRKAFGWKPNVTFEEGIREVIEWGRNEKAIDNVDKAMNELAKRGLR